MYERMAESRPLSWQLSGNVQFWEMYSLAQVLTPLSRKKWPVGAISRSRDVNANVEEIAYGLCYREHI